MRAQQQLNANAQLSPLPLPPTRAIAALAPTPSLAPASRAAMAGVVNSARLSARLASRYAGRSAARRGKLSMARYYVGFAD